MAEAVVSMASAFEELRAAKALVKQAMADYQAAEDASDKARKAWSDACHRAQNARDVLETVAGEGL